MHIVVWQARQSKDNCLSFPISFFSLLLDILSAIPLRVKHTKRMEVRGVWSGVHFVFLLFFFPPLLFSSLHRLYFHGGPSKRGRQSWLGRRDSTFRPNPHLFLHTVVVMMEMVSEKLIEGERDIEGKERWREKVWSVIVEMSRQVRMHWFRITFLFHFNRRMQPFWENAILISRLRPNICTIQIGGYGGNAILTWNTALSSYPAQPHWCFLSLSLLSQNEVL